MQMNCDHNNTAIDPPRPSNKKGTNKLLIQLYLLYSNLLATLIIQLLLNPGFFKKKFWNVTFYISHMQFALRSEFRLVIISAIIINRRLCMTSALTFFLMIFFRNSGKPLMKFSFTNSSPSTSWSFLNPSAQKKNELIFKTWYFPWG